MNGWIKLHRKLLNNDLLKDKTALQIFIWLLLQVDRKNGTMTIGRFWASKELRLKPMTFYDSMKRLEKKYCIIDLTTRKTTIKYTEVRLLNWHKYQNKNDPTTQDDNNSPTINRQLTDTYTRREEYKNIEGTPSISPPKRFSSLKDISTIDLEEISLAYKVPLSFVQVTFERLKNYCEAKGKQYKNYKSALRNFVLLDALKARKEVLKHESKRGIDARSVK